MKNTNTDWPELTELNIELSLSKLPGQVSVIENWVDLWGSVNRWDILSEKSEPKLKRVNIWSIYMHVYIHIYMDQIVGASTVALKMVKNSALKSLEDVSYDYYENLSRKKTKSNQTICSTWGTCGWRTEILSCCAHNNVSTETNRQIETDRRHRDEITSHMACSAVAQKGNGRETVGKWIIFKEIKNQAAINWKTQSKRWYIISRGVTTLDRAL